MSTTYGHIVYNGDSAFAETAESGQRNVDPWGADVCTRIFAGSNDLLPAFEATFKRSRRKQDPDFPQLFMTDYRIEPHRSFPRLVATYKGIIGGKPPEPVIENAMRNDSVTIPFINDAVGGTNGISSSFSYRAPTTTFVYYTRTKPLVPKYPGIVNTRGDAFRITAQNGAPGPLSIFKGKSLSTASAASSKAISSVANFYIAVAECFGTLNYEIIGQWYRATETNVGTLVPFSLANAFPNSNVNG